MVDYCDDGQFKKFKIQYESEVSIADDKNNFFKLLTEEFYKFPPEKLTSLFSQIDLIYQEIIKITVETNEKLLLIDY